MRSFAQLLGELCRIGNTIGFKILTLWLSKNFFIIDKELFIQVGELVTRQAHHTFDVVNGGINRITKHHHVTARGLTKRNYLFINDRQAQPVSEFIDQDQVARLQGWQH